MNSRQSMDPRTFKDPAAGVPAQLLPHLHLMSKHSYPMLTNPTLEQIVQFLLEAPKVIRDIAPVQWQYLDAPRDGSMFLTWQAQDYMGVQFASDGYVWNDNEQLFTSEVRGYTLQMYWQKAGYKPKMEQIASHTRRRYRLTGGNQGIGPQGDSSLWLVHYSKAQQRDQHPVNPMQMLPHVIQQFSQRQVIQASGGLPRKEFMFNDRSSWPIINLPSTLARQRAPTHLRNLSQYEATVEEEEDVSRGDALDFMTPREISRMRYEQHHEWMEEILESPFGIKQIIPPELGIGRKGTLESFTVDFFTAPVSTVAEPASGQIGKLNAGRAEEFTRLASQKLAVMHAELEQMKQEHIKRMEKLKKTTELAVAERKLRSMNMNSNDSFGPIVREAEAVVGKRIEPAKKIHRVAAGGSQEIRSAQQIQHVPQVQQQQQQQQQQNLQNAQVPPQSQQRQFQGQQQQQAQNAGHNVPSTVLQTHDDSVATVQGQVLPDTTAQSKSPEIPQHDDTSTRNVGEVLNDDGGDIDMSGLDAGNLHEGDENVESGDRDLMGDQGLDDDNNDHNQNNDDGDQTQHDSVQTDAGDDNDMTGNVEGFDMVNDFNDNNMDTAGDALADYGTGEGEGDVEGDDLNLNDSAFDDAFHHELQEES